MYHNISKLLIFFKKIRHVRKINDVRKYFLYEIRNN